MQLFWAQQQALYVSHAVVRRDPHAGYGLPVPWPGGLRENQPSGRLRKPPSAAWLKLQEHLDYMGHRPRPAEVCVDLGAFPGGWSSYLAQATKAWVISVDRVGPTGKAMERLLERENLDYVQADALDWRPNRRVDWYCLRCGCGCKSVDVDTWDVFRTLRSRGRGTLSSCLPAFGVCACVLSFFAKVRYVWPSCQHL